MTYNNYVPKTIIDDYSIEPIKLSSIVTEGIVPSEHIRIITNGGGSENVDYTVPVKGYINDFDARVLGATAAASDTVQASIVEGSKLVSDPLNMNVSTGGLVRANFIYNSNIAEGETLRIAVNDAAGSDIPPISCITYLHNRT